MVSEMRGRGMVSLSLIKAYKSVKREQNWREMSASDSVLKPYIVSVLLTAIQQIEVDL